MKWTTIIVALLGLIYCNNRTDNNVVQEKNKMVQFDSLNVDENESNNSGSRPYKKIHNCNLDNFIADKKTPKLAKDIYLDNEWNLSNDLEALALLDSLNAKNKASRPFYFKVVTTAYKKSDGYYSEGLGLAGKEFVENNTQEFISYFENKDCFTDNDLTTWAKILILEFSISCEEGYEKRIIDGFIKKLRSNCMDCSTKQKEKINEFGLVLKKEWNDFQKKTE